MLIAQNIEISNRVLFSILIYSTKLKREQGTIFLYNLQVEIK